MKSVQVLSSTGRIFQCLMAVNENADCAKAVRLRGTDLHLVQILSFCNSAIYLSHGEAEENSSMVVLVHCKLSWLIIRPSKLKSLDLDSILQWWCFNYFLFIHSKYISLLWHHLNQGWGTFFLSRAISIFTTSSEGRTNYWTQPLLKKTKVTAHSFGLSFMYKEKATS